LHQPQLFGSTGGATSQNISRNFLTNIIAGGDVAVMRNHRTVLAVIGILAALCVNGVRAADEPFFDGLGSYQRSVTTGSPEAQKYFNQGLAFLQGLNHAEAIRSFQAAAQADPHCAMAHWGIAYACGPHINLPVVPPPAAELAWKELALARE